MIVVCKVSVLGGSALFEVGDLVEGLLEPYSCHTVTEVHPSWNPGQTYAVRLEGNPGLHNPTYWKLVDPPQVVAGYMELFL